MERTFFFTAHPSEEELNVLAKGLEGPFSVEIKQVRTVSDPPLGIRSSVYHEFLDCDTIAELHAFMCTGDYAVSDNEDFTVIIEEINPPPDDDDDHPSLTAAERNPSMVN
jgi:hypothetical protein